MCADPARRRWHSGIIIIIIIIIIIYRAPSTE
jgi:hypothetical protein